MAIYSIVVADDIITIDQKNIYYKNHFMVF